VAGVVLVWFFRDPELVAEHRAGLHNWVRGQFRERPS
jgi:hypothetical protein